jgi:copper homeostasis protein
LPASSRFTASDRPSRTPILPAKLDRMLTEGILEITVDTLDRALAAERGGAHRIELCSDLSQGGLTPDPELMRSVREMVRLPIFVMIRPRGGNFVYTDAEYAAMRREIEIARRRGADGLVFGILEGDGRVDVRRTQRLVELAEPLPVTFHRAIDSSADIRRALEDVIKSGAARILSSGGAATAMEGLECLADLVRVARDRVVVVPGSGITTANVARIAGITGAREFHAGLSSVSVEGGRDGPKFFEEEVRRLVRTLQASGWSKLRTQ